MTFTACLNSGTPRQAASPCAGCHELDALAVHRGQLLVALRAGRERGRAEMANQSDQDRVQSTPIIRAGDFGR